MIRYIIDSYYSSPMSERREAPSWAKFSREMIPVNFDFLATVEEKKESQAVTAQNIVLTSVTVGWGVYIYSTGTNSQLTSVHLSVFSLNGDLGMSQIEMWSTGTDNNLLAELERYRATHNCRWSPGHLQCPWPSLVQLCQTYAATGPFFGRLSQKMSKFSVFNRLCKHESHIFWSGPGSQRSNPECVHEEGEWATSRGRPVCFWSMDIEWELSWVFSAELTSCVGTVLGRFSDWMIKLMLTWHVASPVVVVVWTVVLFC